MQTKSCFFTCHYIGRGEYWAVAVPVPCQHSHSVVLSTLQLGQLTGHAGGAAGVHVPAGLGDDCVMICSSTGLPRHSRNTGGAVQGSGYICGVAGSWRGEGKKSIVYDYIFVMMKSFIFILWNSTCRYIGDSSDFNINKLG